MMNWFHRGGKFLLLLALLLAGCTQQPADLPCKNGVPVGVVIASDTQEGAEQREGYQIAGKEINDAGGINGCPVSLQFEPKAGSENSTETVQQALLDLDDMGVVAILGATSNEASKRMAALAGYTKTPVIITPDTADDLMDGAGRWVFRINPSNQDYAAAAFTLLQNNPMLGISLDILFEDTEYGEAAAITAGQVALDNKLVILRYERYSAAEKDFGSLVDKVQKDRPAVIYWISSDPVQGKAILQQMASKAVQSILIGSGRGFSSSTLLYDKDGAITPGLQNLFLPLSWSADLPNQAPDNFQQILADYRKSDGSDSPNPPTVNTVQAYTALKVLAEALKTVAPITGNDWNTTLEDSTKLAELREKVMEAMRAGRYQTPFGSLEFDSTGQSKLEALLVQVRDQELITVYHTGFDTASPALRSPSGLAP